MSLFFSIMNILHRGNVTRVEEFFMNSKLKYILVVSVLSFMLCACSRAEMNREEGIGNMQVINPIKQVTAEELQEQMQISLVGVPENASDVAYTTIETGSEKIAQIKFTLDNANVFVRSMKTDSAEIMDISGLYYEWTETIEAQVGNCEAIVFIKDHVGYIAWRNLETGIVYNLGMTEGTDADTLIELANEVFR